MTSLKNWQISQQDNRVVLTLDIPKKSQNVLSAEVIEELSLALDQVEQLNADGLIIKSGKNNGFIAGADISEFEKVISPDQALAYTSVAHSILNRIESLKMPTVAMLNGHCLGGGLELALACDYRVVSDDTSIRLGLPEVMLGIHPGFGGTVRLAEIIGVTNAMDLMLSGRTVIPHVAKKMGIVDLSVPPRQLQRAVEFVLNKKAPPKKAGNWDKLLNLAPVRSLMAGYLRKKVSGKAKQAHYPAPFAVIDLWKTHGGDRKAMLQAEQESVSNLVLTPTSKNLVKVFFLQEELKKSGQSKSKKTKEKFRHVHVIGAGIMGGDIASWCVLQGLKVTIHDRSPEALAKATERAHQLFRKKLKRPRPIERAMDRFHQDLAGVGARNADVIIEAIFENVDAKIGVFSEMEKIAKPDAILATNTSSIPLETISAALKKPGRLVGLHFFNPVAKMRLVEIVNGEKTFAKVLHSAAAFAAQISRLPVAVKSSPGFLVNRVLMPYTLEAVELLKEGIPAPLIDKVATDFGMPMGPVVLADTVGLDICYHVGENLTQSFGGEIPDILKTKIDVEKLGKKSGEGFYVWEKGQPKKGKFDATEHDTQEIEDRLIFKYLNECVACLSEGIVDNSEQADAALVFGTGFAPFKGGPVNYIRDQGIETMQNKMIALHEKLGDRFKPATGWENL